MAEITKVWFIHNYASGYHNHSTKGPLVFVNKEDAEQALESMDYKLWSVCSWGVDDKLKLIEKVAEIWKPIDSEFMELPAGAEWLHDLRAKSGHVIAKLPQPKKAVVAVKKVEPVKPVKTDKPKKDTTESDALRAQLKDMGKNPRNIKDVAKLRRMVEMAYQVA